MGNSGSKEDLWKGKEDVEILTGVRDKEKILCFSVSTNTTKLLKPDGSRICAVTLKDIKSKGTLTVAEVEYEIKHNAGSDTWDLVLGDKVLCRAKQPKTSRTKVLLDEYDENRSVKRRLRMQTRVRGLQDFDYYEIATEASDEVAMKDGSLYMSITKTYSKKDWEVKKLRDEISDVFLAFSFSMFAIFYRRTTDENYGTSGSIETWRRGWLFANFFSFCRNVRCWWSGRIWRGLLTQLPLRYFCVGIQYSVHLMPIRQIVQCDALHLLFSLV